VKETLDVGDVAVTMVIAGFLIMCIIIAIEIITPHRYETPEPVNTKFETGELLS